MPAASAAPPATVTLQGGASWVTLLPERGLLTEVAVAGRRWGWHNPWLPPAPVADGAAWADAECGGIEDRFPSSSAGQIPSWVPSLGGRALPAGGLCWQVRPAFALATDPAGHHATVTWSCDLLGARLTRVVTVRGDGVVRLDYRLEATGAHKVPFTWSLPVPVALADDPVLELPAGARMRLAWGEGLDLGAPGGAGRWPQARVGDALLDLSRPAALPGRFEAVLVVDLAAGEVAVRVGGARLVMRGTAVGAPWRARVHLLRDARTAPGAPRRWLPWPRPEGYRVAALGLQLGAPDALEPALGDWDAAEWVAPGVPRSWAVEITGEEDDGLAR